MPKQIILVRHGQTHYNAARRFTGAIDDVLTETGHWQSQQVAQFLQEFPIEQVITSSLVRTQQTAHPLVASASINTTVMAELNERDLGAFNGQNIDEVFAKHPHFSQEVFNSPTNQLGVENLIDFRQRLKKAVKRINQLSSDTIAIFSHGGSIRHLIPLVTETTEQVTAKIGNTSVTVFEKNTHKYEVKLLASTKHLERN